MIFCPCLYLCIRYKYVFDVYLMLSCHFFLSYLSQQGSKVLEYSNMTAYYMPVPSYKYAVIIQDIWTMEIYALCCIIVRKGR